MYFSKSKQKQKPYILDTRPSHNQSLISFTSQHDEQQINNKKFKHIFKDKINDSTIKFQNNWIYKGRHFQGKFHGWGELLQPDQKIIYKGNFYNGYFDKLGKIINHEMFSYLFDLKQIKKWIKGQHHNLQSQKNDLKQIQIVNPLKSTDNNIYSFKKQSNLRKQYQLNQQNNLKLKINKIQWLKYKGQFEQGNATGFGTLKLKIQLVANKQSKLYINEKVIKIIGKFIEGKLITGTIKI